MTPRQCQTLCGLLLNIVIAAYLVAFILAGVLLVDLHRDLREQEAVDSMRALTEEMRTEFARLTK